MGLKENLSVVWEKIEEAACACGRDPAEIRLIAVSKTKPAEMVREAYACGVRDFGENRVQELVEKSKILPGDIRWHQIGHLQKNKVKYVINQSVLIHSLDSIALAQEIQKRAAAEGCMQEVLLQVNVTGEESKFGIEKEALPGLCAAVAECENIRVRGLMTISVKGYSEVQNRAVFQELRTLSEMMQAEGYPNFDLRELSMGMTHDFQEAIAEGATMVRVGTAVFGERVYNI